MRLINTTSLELHSFFNRTVPHYAILSHCWGEDEVSLQDFSSDAQHKTGYRKIVDICRLAREESGLDWTWVDTCCIDKTSSAELSESINSMYRWYKESEICYAFLTDVSVEIGSWTQDFANSRWFTRGWTLQELLAPRLIRFLVKNTKYLGLSLMTPRGGDAHRKTSIACRMSWASQRQTTREEDMAYCLLGIFNVNMPLLYGEGQKAFRRLQEEIISSSTDDSIFAWVIDGESDESSKGGLLASSVKDFAHCNNIDAMKSNARHPTIVTKDGIQIHYAITDPIDLGRQAFHWLIGGSISSVLVDFDLSCVHEVDGESFEWISIPLKRASRDDGFYYTADRTSLLRRQVNLSLVSRFYAKVYVNHDGHDPREVTHLMVIGKKGLHDGYHGFLQFALLLRVPLDWVALSLFCVFSQRPNSSSFEGPAFYFFAVVNVLVFFDHGPESVVRGERYWIWLKSCFGYMYVFMLLCLPSWWMLLRWRRV